MYFCLIAALNFSGLQFLFLVVDVVKYWEADVNMLDCKW